MEEKRYFVDYFVSYRLDGTTSEVGSKIRLATCHFRAKDRVVVELDNFATVSGSKENERLANSIKIATSWRSNGFERRASRN